jgi:hypothetical protein
LSDYYEWSGDDSDDSQIEQYDLEEVLFGSQYDAHAQELMWDAVIAGKDSSAWTNLGDYLYQMYDIDLEAEWDWEDFREWYESS